MPDRNVSGERFDASFREHLRHEPYVLVRGDALAVRHRDAGAFLTAVLEREESEEGCPAYVDSLVVDAEDGALLTRDFLHTRLVNFGDAPACRQAGKGADRLNE